MVGIVGQVGRRIFRRNAYDDTPSGLLLLLMLLLMLILLLEQV